MHREKTFYNLNIQDRPTVSELSYSKGLTTISNHLMQRTPNFLVLGTNFKEDKFSTER